MMRDITRARSAEVICLPPEDSQPYRIHSNAPASNIHTAGLHRCPLVDVPAAPNSVLRPKAPQHSVPARPTLPSKLIIARIFSKKPRAHREGGQGRKDRDRPHYEREFISSERLFRVREILCPKR